MDKKLNILITGANGYIAKKIISSISSEHSVLTISRQNFDLRSASETNKFFKKFNNDHFDFVIHTAISGGNRLKKDCYDDLCGNLRMFDNLTANKNKFRKLINLGSGAETYGLNTYYGLSKKIISKIIEENFNFYNLKIFAVFDEDEDERRFIKTNINNHINKKAIVIHKDKKMDFFYMKDLISVINFYLTNESLPKELDCSYKKHYKLSEIADMINCLSGHRVDIKYDKEGLDSNYTGTYKEIGLKYIGLKKAIREVYKNITSK